MHKEIETVITEIYGNRNKDFFVSCCYREMGFIMDFGGRCKRKVSKCNNKQSRTEDPSVDIIFQLKDFVESNFAVKYSSSLKIS